MGLDCKLKFFTEAEGGSRYVNIVKLLTTEMLVGESLESFLIRH